MERIINVHIEKLPEGYYLATSDDMQGLVAQGRTVAETLEIDRDLVRRLIEAHLESENKDESSLLADSFDLPLVVGA